MMKILVTGAGGMLGCDVLDACAAEEVLATDITGDHKHLDISDRDQVFEVLRRFAPDVILHLAAFTNVDGAQTTPEPAWTVNAGGTWNLAAAACEQDCALLYISTDFVFNGDSERPYDEFDIPDPISSYGRTKYAGEMVVRQLVRKHYVVRTSWLYGVHGKSFPGTMIQLASQGRPLRVVGDQVGSPTHTVDLADSIMRIIRQPLYGTYHVTNTGECSWYDLARETLSLYGIENPDLIKITSEEWPTPTRRPKYSVLAHRGLDLAGLPDTRPWQDALADFVNRYKQKYKEST